MGADQPVLGRAGGSTDDDTGPRVAFRGSHGAIDARLDSRARAADDLVAGLRCDAECFRGPASGGRARVRAELRRIEGHLVAQLTVRARAGLRRDLPDRADRDDHAPLPFRTDGPRVKRDLRGAARRRTSPRRRAGAPSPPAPAAPSSEGTPRGQEGRGPLPRRGPPGPRATSRAPTRSREPDGRRCAVRRRVYVLLSAQAGRFLRQREKTIVAIVG